MLRSTVTHIQQLSKQLSLSYSNFKVFKRLAAYPQRTQRRPGLSTQQLCLSNSNNNSNFSWLKSQHFNSSTVALFSTRQLLQLQMLRLVNQVMLSLVPVRACTSLYLP